MADFTLDIELDGNSDNFRQAVSAAQQSVSTFEEKTAKLSNKIKKIGGSLSKFGNTIYGKLTAPIVSAGQNMAGAAADYDANLKQIEAAFGQSSNSVKAWADNAITQFGLSKNQALEMSAVFGQMASAMGLPQSAAAQMSVNLSGLASDLAAFQGISIEQAMSALNGVFTGESEGLQALGVTMSQANLDAFALSNGFGKTTEQMSLAEQAQLRYAYVMSATNSAQGMYAQTSDTASGSMQLFKSAVDNLYVVLGEQLLPIITPLIEKAAELINSFAQASPQLQQFILVVAGIAAAAGPVLMVIGSIITGIGGVIDAASFLSSAIGKFGEVVKPIISAVTGLFKTLFGVIQANPVAAVITVIIAILVTLYTKCEWFRDGVNTVIGMIVGFFQGLGTNVANIFSNIFSTASNIFSRIGNFISGVIDGIKGGISTLTGVFSNIFGAVYDTVSSIMNRVKGTVTGVFDGIKSAWNGLTSFVSGIFSGIGNAVQSLVGKVKGFVNGVIGGINAALGVINLIPGVEIPKIPYLAHGTDRWAGGFAYINESGRGELTYLPNGAQVIPHDISVKYAKESAKANSRAVPSQGLELEYISEKIIGALSGVVVRHETTLNGKIVASELAPLINKRIGRQYAQDIRR